MPSAGSQRVAETHRGRKAPGIIQEWDVRAGTNADSQNRIGSLALRRIPDREECLPEKLSLVRFEALPLCWQTLRQTRKGCVERLEAARRR